MRYVLALPLVFVAGDSAFRKIDVPAHTDVLGDPLPTGATARFGSVRWQPGGPITHLIFSPDGDELVSVSSPGAMIGTTADFSRWDSVTGREIRHVRVTGVRVEALSWARRGQPVAVLRGRDRVFLWEFSGGAGDPSSPDGGQGADFSELTQFAISPDGKRIAVGRSASAGQARGIDIRAAETGKSLRDLPLVRALGPQGGDCTGLLFTPDGKRLLAFSRPDKAEEELLVEWDLGNGEQLSWRTVPLAVHNGRVKAMAVAPDGKTLALGLPDGTARLIDLAGTVEPRSVGYHPRSRYGYQGVSGVGFSRDGRTLVTGGRDGLLRTWDAATGKDIRTLDAKSGGWFEHLAFSPDGKRLAAPSGRIRVWNLETGADLSPTIGHQKNVNSVTVAPDGKTVASVGGDTTLRFWNPATGRENRVVELGGWAGQCAYFPDGHAVLVGVDEKFRAWDGTGQPVDLPPELAAARGRFHGFSTDGRTLLTSDKGNVSLWDWPAGRLRRTIELPADTFKPEEVVCGSPALSPDGRFLVTSSYRQYMTRFKDGTQSNISAIATELWDANTGQRLARLTKPAANYAHFAFTANGRSLVIAGIAGSSTAEALSLWDPRKGECRRAFAPPEQNATAGRRSIRDVAVSPDGRCLATAEDDGSILIYEIATGQVRRRLAGHLAPVASLAFTPDGKRLISGSYDYTALVWDVSLTGPADDERPTGWDIKRSWELLADRDGATTFQSMQCLTASPAEFLEFVRKFVRPAEGVDEAKIIAIVADLDAASFAVRERASAELDVLGEPAVAVVDALAAKSPSAEVRRRLDRFLAKHDRDEPTDEQLVQGRILEILEQIGSPDARAVLRELAGGAPTARLTREATAALRRLERPAE
jgi:WD40 repeat protein